MSGASGENAPTSAAKLVLVGVCALVQVIPGYTTLTDQKLYPAGADYFPAGALGVGAITVLLAYLARSWISERRLLHIAGLSVGALLLSLVLTVGYKGVLDSRSVPYEITDDNGRTKEYRFLIPLGSSRWVSPALLDSLRLTNTPKPATVRDVEPRHFKRYLEHNPNGVRAHIPPLWSWATTATLWTWYTAAVALLVVGFTLPAMRLGFEYTDATPKKAKGDEVVTVNPPPEEPAAALIARLEGRLAGVESELQRTLTELQRPQRPAELHVRVSGPMWASLFAAGVAAILLSRGRRD